ncbi:MAG: hypothetical protein FWE23_06105 [Chitinivibrionia bacterium]|nr:hypothetical protein [Chitinivibrionia bacterium]
MAQIKVSEVMRNPIGGRTAARAHQYIEIVNLGDETVSIEGMRLFTGAVFNNILPVERGAIPQGITGTSEIKSGQIAIILSREIIPIFEQFRHEIPDDVVVLTVNLITICGGFAANDGFVIIRANDTIAEFRNAFENGRYKVHPTTPETNGFSLVPQSLLCRDAMLASPVWNVEIPTVGKIKNFNNGVLREYQIERQGNEFAIKILYRNFGRTAKIEGKNLSQNSGEISLTKPLASSVIFEINIENQTFFDTIWTANLFAEKGSVVISEVDARASVEWIELYWKNECFPLEGWHLLVGGSVVNLPRLECPPNRILCVSERESSGLVEMTRVPNWRKINNFEDTIYLVAPFGVIDSIAFTRDIWTDSRDRSTVQRRDINGCGFDSDNVFAGTANPGAVLRFTPQRNFSINLSSKKFTPNGDGHLDSLIITASKPRSGTVKIEIYAMDGNLLRTFESPAQTRFSWDGRNEFGRIAPVGPVFVIGTFEGGGRKFTDRKNAVLWR